MIFNLNFIIIFRSAFVLLQKLCITFYLEFQVFFSGLVLCNFFTQVILVRYTFLGLFLRAVLFFRLGALVDLCCVKNSLVIGAF